MHGLSSGLAEKLAVGRFVSGAKHSPGFSLGLYSGLLYSAIDTYVFRSRAPWTFHHKKPDHDSLKPAAKCKPIVYPKHDNKITFDLMSSVFFDSFDL